MIVIVGASHDDILYFDSVLTNRNEEIILNKYPITRGMMFNQEIVVVGGCF